MSRATNPFAEEASPNESMSHSLLSGAISNHRRDSFLTSTEHNDSASSGYQPPPFHEPPANVNPSSVATTYPIALSSAFLSAPPVHSHLQMPGYSSPGLEDDGEENQSGRYSRRSSQSQRRYSSANAAEREREMSTGKRPLLAELLREEAEQKIEREILNQARSRTSSVSSGGTRHSVHQSPGGPTGTGRPSISESQIGSANAASLLSEQSLAKHSFVQTTMGQLGMEDLYGESETPSASASGGGGRLSHHPSHSPGLFPANSASAADHLGGNSLALPQSNGRHRGSFSAYNFAQPLNSVSKSVAYGILSVGSAGAPGGEDSDGAALLPGDLAALSDAAEHSQQLQQQQQQHLRLHHFGAAEASIVPPESPASPGPGVPEPSAITLEREMLSSPPAKEHEAGPGPLLSDYQKANSSIRTDFTTVDWFFSKSKMHRARRLLIEANTEEGSLWGKIKNMWLAAQGWVILLLVGIVTALSAAVIHSGSAWLSDLKGGYCSGQTFFATRRVCCMDQQFPGSTCPNWSPWSAGVAHEGTAGATIYNGMVYIVLSIVMAGLGSWICVIFARQAAGSGIAELKILLGGFVLKKFLGIRTLLFKTLGLTLAVASGLALGKEGPMVHIACAWGHIISRAFIKYQTNEVKRREILSASVAAGVTAAFGAPLGGVLFSLEVVSSYFSTKTMWRSFWCAICTALMLQFLDPFQTGKLVQFAVEITKWQWFEIMPCALLGVLGGVVGGLFVRFNVAMSRLRKRYVWWRTHPIGEILCIALLTSLISYPDVFLKGNSGSLLAQLFSNCENLSVAAEYDRNAGSDSVISALCDHNASPWGMIGLLVVAGICKLALATVTYGSAIPSGVFMPSLVVGALFGRVVGWLMWDWQNSIGNTFIFSVCDGQSQCINRALYAVVGASAMLGGITRMTVSLAVIMFEVTGGLSIIVPIMIAVVLAKWTGDAVARGGGLYAHIIRLNGLPHIDPHQDFDFQGQAADIMTLDPVCLTTYGMTIQQLQLLLAEHVYHGFPILDNPHDKLITGFISRSDLEFLLGKLDSITHSRARHTRVHFSREPPPYAVTYSVDFSPGVDKHPLTVRPSMPIDRVINMVQSLGLRYLLCVSPRGKIMGIIKKKDVLFFLRKNNVSHY